MLSLFLEMRLRSHITYLVALKFSHILLHGLFLSCKAFVVLGEIRKCSKLHPQPPNDDVPIVESDAALPTERAVQDAAFLRPASNHSLYFELRFLQFGHLLHRTIISYSVVLGPVLLLVFLGRLLPFERAVAV